MSGLASRRASKLEAQTLHHSPAPEAFGRDVGERDEPLWRSPPPSGRLRLSLTDSLVGRRPGRRSPPACGRRPHAACERRRAAVRLSILMHSAPSWDSRCVQKGPAA